VTNGRICATCEANERGLCRYAGARFEGDHRHLVKLFEPAAGHPAAFAAPRWAGR
jgi:hypothetical protein